MQLENVISVPLGPDRVWDFLLDVEEVVPCMPGATLTETIDDKTWKGRVSISLGPLTLSYAGVVEMTERDEQARRASLRAEGTETRGKGQAQASVTFNVEPGDNGGTRLIAITDLELSGPAAQYGKPMLTAVTQQLSKQFAQAVTRRLSSEEPSAPSGQAASEPAPTAKPIAGLRLLVSTLAGGLARLARRLLRRSGSNR